MANSGQNNIQAPKQNLTRIAGYLALGAFAIAVAMPVALATASSNNGGLFVECFTDSCDNDVSLAFISE